MATCFCLSKSARRRAISSGDMRAMFWKSSFQSGLALQASGDCTVVRAAGADSSTSRARASVAACDSASFGRPAGLPSGKSENSRRGTPTCSTMSLAQPITTVAMPAASSARAASAMLWWQTGQLAARMAASTPSSLQRATTSGQSTSSVTRWLRLVGSP